MEKTKKCKRCGKKLLWKYNKTGFCPSCFIVDKRKHKKYRYCVDCKKILRGHGKPIRCSSCSSKYNHQIGLYEHLKVPFPKCKYCGKRISNSSYYVGKQRCHKCANKGKNNPAWTGGINKMGYPYKFNKYLKETIRRRDGYICQLCGAKQKDYYRKLDIHHIDYNKDNINKNNLISLCGTCNCQVNTARDYWFAYFKYIMENK